MGTRTEPNTESRDGPKVRCWLCSYSRFMSTCEGSPCLRILRLPSDLTDGLVSSPLSYNHRPCTRPHLADHCDVNVRDSVQLLPDGELTWTSLAYSARSPDVTPPIALARDRRSSSGYREQLRWKPTTRLSCRQCDNQTAIQPAARLLGAR